MLKPRLIPVLLLVALVTGALFSVYVFTVTPAPHRDAADNLLFAVGPLMVEFQEAWEYDWHSTDLVGRTTTGHAVTTPGVSVNWYAHRSPPNAILRLSGRTLAKMTGCDRWAVSWPAHPSFDGCRHRKAK